MAEVEKLPPSAEEEIKELERKLEEKKREMAQREIAPREEKEILREVLRERVEEVTPGRPKDTGILSGIPHVPPLTEELQKKADEVKTKEREEQVRNLVELALSKSIEDAVKVAQQATPYLLDELHDHLVDDYYEKLVQLKKIKAL
jgi:hypothetical protein